MNGELRKMTDVYISLDLRSNIISLGQETEAGCDIKLRGETLTMHDQTGKLLVNARRSPNRLYKVRMGIKNVTCLLLTSKSESHKWHARLGHVNADTIKLMIRKELVQGIPNVDIEKKICVSCLLGKQTRQTFPQATSYRAYKVLQLIHADLCGPDHIQYTRQEQIHLCSH